eukprot:401670_1
MASREDSQDRRARLSLGVGSSCTVYSRSSNKWIDGRITKIFIDTQTKQEWFIVKYGKNKTKKIQRFCAALRPTEIQQCVTAMLQSNLSTRGITFFYHPSYNDMSSLNVENSNTECDFGGYPLKNVADLYVSPRYDSLKEELMSHMIPYQQLVEKANQYLQEDACK